MKTETINFEALKTLASYLLSAELHIKPRIIDVDLIFIPYEDGSFEYIEPSFSWVVEEFPWVFPEDWIETEKDGLHWVLDEEKTALSSMKAFFGLNERMLGHLLVPYRQNIERYAGRILSKEASRFEIGINIVEFVLNMQQYSNPISRPIFLN